MLTKKNRVWAMAAVAVAVTGFSACLKSPDPGPPERPVASVIVLNAATFDAGFDMFDNEKKMNETTPIKLGFVSAYRAIGGIHAFTFKKTGADSVAATTPPMQMDSLNYYSVISYGNNPIKAIALNDDVSNVKENTKIYYRFFHMSPNAGAVDVYIDTKKIDSARVYEDRFSRGFTALELNMASEIIIKKAGTDEVLTKVSNSSLKPGLSLGNVYNIYIAGIKDRLDGNKLFVSATIGAVNLN